MARKKYDDWIDRDVPDRLINERGARRALDFGTASNHRNGTSPKTVDTGSERVVLDIPRDRHGRFDPVLIAKYQRRFPSQIPLHPLHFVF